MSYFKFKGASPDNVTVGATSTKILSKNEARGYVCLVNDSDEEIYLSIGNSKPAVMNKGIRLNAYGGSWEMNRENMTNEEVYAICASGSKVLCVTEHDATDQ